MSAPSSSKRPREEMQHKDIWGQLEDVSASTNHEALVGAVPLAAYILEYKSKHKKADVDFLARVLEGMTIRKMVGTNKRYTCKGVIGKDGKGLPNVDLGLTEISKQVVEAAISECAVYYEDHTKNELLRRLVSRDNLREIHSLTAMNFLRGKWQLVYLGEEDLSKDETLKKFRKRVGTVCGEANEKELGDVICIRNEAQLGAELSRHVDGRTEVLLCVMQKRRDYRFYRALKREAELEKKFMTKCCHVSTVRDNVKGNAPNVSVTTMGLEMLGRIGAYRKRSFFLSPPLPTRFHGEKAMLFGCHVSDSYRPVTVMVGNVGTSDRSAGDYVCKLAQGDYNMTNFGKLFGELVEKYEQNNEGSCLAKRIIFFREGVVRSPVKVKLPMEVDALRQVAGDDGVRITYFVRQRLSSSKQVSVSDTKCIYSVYIDENGFTDEEFRTVMSNLSYSGRYRDPLPAIYANRAAKMAETYLDGNSQNPDLKKVAETIDKSLYVVGERDDEKGKGAQVVVSYMEE